MNNFQIATLSSHKQTIEPTALTLILSLIKAKSYITLVSMIFLFSCTPSNKTEFLPIVSSDKSAEITQTTALIRSVIKLDNESNITARGVCWSTKTNPTISDNTTNDGKGFGEFFSFITNLSPHTNYYMRAYAISNNGVGYGGVYQFTTNSATPTVVDVDGNVYHTVVIGTQVWMQENLRTTKYNDGNIISYVSDSSKWNNYNTGICRSYGLDPMGKKYGMLYNWYTVNTGKLAPIGWHIPTYDEWLTLREYVNSNLNKSSSVAAALATSNLWDNSCFKGTSGIDYTTNNSSGFSAIPTPQYLGITFYASNWWSATKFTENFAYGFYITSDSNDLNSSYAWNKVNGNSIRCIKD